QVVTSGNNDAWRGGLSVVYLSADDPAWRRLVEVRFHRAEDSVSVAVAARGEQRQHPSPGRPFIVIDEGDEIAGRVLDCGIPRQRDVLLRLDAVADANRRPSGREFVDDSLRGSL